MVLNKPFDINKIESIESGPKDHIYALSSDKKLALIRFDTAYVADTLRIIHRIVKVINLNQWIGNEKLDLKINFSSSSEDGRFLALSVKYEFSEFHWRNTIFPWLGSKLFLLLIDFRNEVIEFRHEFKDPFVFNSQFRNGRFYFTESVRNQKCYSYDLLTGKMAFERERERSVEKSLINIGFTYENKFFFMAGEMFRFNDFLNQITFSKTNDTLIISSITKTLFKVKVSDSSKVHFNRLRDHYLITDEFNPKGYLFNTRNNTCKEIDEKSTIKFRPTSLLNDKMLSTSMLNGFRIWDFTDNRHFFTGGRRKMIKSKNEVTSFHIDALSNLKRTKSFAHVLGKANQAIIIDINKRLFRFEKGRQKFDSASYYFASRNSENFRISEKYKGDTMKIFDAGGNLISISHLLLNGTKIGYSLGESKTLIDISKGDNFTIISNIQFNARELISFSKSGKRNWYSFNNSRIELLKIDSDDKSIKTCSENKVIDLWDSKGGRKFLSLYLDTASMDWVLYTPSGYYDCSPNGERLIGWSVSRGTDSLPAYYPAGRFRDKFYRPDVIDSALKYCSEDIALKKIGLRKGKKAQKQITQNLPPIIHLESPGMNEIFSDTLINIQYRVQNGTSPVHTIRVLLDGRPWKELKPERGVQSISLSIPPKDCSIGLVAISASGESELSFSRLIWKGKKADEELYKKANLYILAIGISKYKSEKLRLEYSAKDALDFCNSLRGQSKGGLYEKVDIKLLTDSFATRENIEAGLEWLEKNTTSRDVCMIFMAGHGENDANNAFYFLPWGADAERMKSTCVSYTTFKSTIESLPGKVLVFADACRSGNILGDLTRRDANIDQLSRELSSGNGGAIVFSSSSRKQASLESNLWNNGAFTKALVEGLNGEADPNKQDYISVLSLGAYISYRVKELTEGRQHPHTAIPESIHDFAIAVKR